MLLEYWPETFYHSQRGNVMGLQKRSPNVPLCLSIRLLGYSLMFFHKTHREELGLCSNRHGKTRQNVRRGSKALKQEQSGLP